MMKSSKLSSSPYWLRPAVCHSQLKLANGPHLLSCQSQAITFCNCKLLCFINLFVCHMCPFVIVYVCFQRHPLVSKMSINADHFEKRQFLYLFDFVLVWWNLALLATSALKVVLKLYFLCFCSLYEGRPQLVGCQSTNHFLHETLHFSALVFCKRWGSLWLAVSDFYYLSLVLTNHNYLSKILSRSSITRVPVEISFEVLNFVSLHIFASAIVLSLWRTLLFFSIIVFSVTFLSINER